MAAELNDELERTLYELCVSLSVSKDKSEREIALLKNSQPRYKFDSKGNQFPEPLFANYCPEFMQNHVVPLPPVIQDVYAIQPDILKKDDNGLSLLQYSIIKLKDANADQYQWGIGLIQKQLFLLFVHIATKFYYAFFTKDKVFLKNEFHAAVNAKTLNGPHKGKSILWHYIEKMPWIFEWPKTVFLPSYLERIYINALQKEELELGFSSEPGVDVKLADVITNAINDRTVGYRLLRMLALVGFPLDIRVEINEVGGAVVFLFSREIRYSSGNSEIDPYILLRGIYSCFNNIKDGTVSHGENKYLSSNQRNIDGDTPLHLACCHLNQQAVEGLLSWVDFETNVLWPEFPPEKLTLLTHRNFNEPPETPWDVMARRLKDCHTHVKELEEAYLAHQASQQAGQKRKKRKLEKDTSKELEKELKKAKSELKLAIDIAIQFGKLISSRIDYFLINLLQFSTPDKIPPVLLDYILDFVPLFEGQNQEFSLTQLANTPVGRGLFTKFIQNRLKNPGLSAAAYRIRMLRLEENRQFKRFFTERGYAKKIVRHQKNIAHQNLVEITEYSHPSDGDLSMSHELQNKLTVFINNKSKMIGSEILGNPEELKSWAEKNKLTFIKTKRSNAKPHHPEELIEDSSSASMITMSSFLNVCQALQTADTEWLERHVNRNNVHIENDAYGRNVLHDLAWRVNHLSFASCIRIVKTKGKLDINRGDVHGRTPLHFVLLKLLSLQLLNDFHMLQVISFIQEGADIYLKDKSGTTVWDLIRGLLTKRPEFIPCIINALIENSILLFLKIQKDTNNIYINDWQFPGNCPEIMDKLKKVFCAFDKAQGKEDSVKEYAEFECDELMITKMPFNLRDEDGNSVLHLAAQNLQIDTLKNLLNIKIPFNRLFKDIDQPLEKRNFGKPYPYSLMQLTLSNKKGETLLDLVISLEHTIEDAILEINAEIEKLKRDLERSASPSGGMGLQNHKRKTAEEYSIEKKKYEDLLIKLKELKEKLTLVKQAKNLIMNLIQPFIDYFVFKTFQYKKVTNFHEIRDWKGDFDTLFERFDIFSKIIGIFHDNISLRDLAQTKPARKVLLQAFNKALNSKHIVVWAMKTYMKDEKARKEVNEVIGYAHKTGLLHNTPTHKNVPNPHFFSEPNSYPLLTIEMEDLEKPKKALSFIDCQTSKWDPEELAQGKHKPKLLEGASISVSSSLDSDETGKVDATIKGLVKKFQQLRDGWDEEMIGVQQLPPVPLLVFSGLEPAISQPAMMQLDGDQIDDEQNQFLGLLPPVPHSSEPMQLGYGDEDDNDKGDGLGMPSFNMWGS